MEKVKLERLQKLFLCLSDATRLRIIEMLASGERSVGEFVGRLGEAQPKISRHLATLRDEGIVSTRREGKHVYYQLDRTISPRLMNAVLSEIVGGMASSELHDQQNIYVTPDMYASPDAPAPEDADDGLPVFLL
jgi:ArsR family transcriptional regulator